MYKPKTGRQPLIPQEPFRQILASAIKATLPDCGVIRSYHQVPFYNDEPKIYQYVAKFCVGSDRIPGRTDFSYGTCFAKETALLKALCEGIERHCLSLGGNDVRTGSAANLGLPIVNLGEMAYFANSQLSQRRYENFCFDSNTRFNWVKGYDVVRKAAIWLPAQLVHLPYTLSDERTIRFPDSTGAACGASKSAALVRGILEVLERDSYICWYLTKSNAKIIDLANSANPLLNKVAEIYRRYRLELTVLRLPSEMPFPIVMAVIIDRTAVGPAVSVGLKAHFDGLTAVIGAIAEAQQSRPWQRDFMYKNKRISKKRASSIHTFDERARFWSEVRHIRLLTSLWRRDGGATFEQAFRGSPKPASWKEALKILMRTAMSTKLDVYSVDLTSDAVRGLGFSVVKAIIPQAQPVYFDERYPYWGGARLRVALEMHGPRWGALSNGRLTGFVPPHPFI